MRKRRSVMPLPIAPTSAPAAISTRPSSGKPIVVASSRCSALSAPSKSDLQQGDIVIVEDKAVQQRIAAAITDMPWIADAPAFLVFVAKKPKATSGETPPDETHS